MRGRGAGRAIIPIPHGGASRGRGRILWSLRACYTCAFMNTFWVTPRPYEWDQKRHRCISSCVQCSYKEFFKSAHWQPWKKPLYTYGIYRHNSRLAKIPPSSFEWRCPGNIRPTIWDDKKLHIQIHRCGNLIRPTHFVLGLSLGLSLLLNTQEGQPWLNQYIQIGHLFKYLNMLLIRFPNYMPEGHACL